MPKLKNINKLVEAWSKAASGNTGTPVVIEEPEYAMHRFVEHALTNRFVVDCEMEEGMVAISFGKGRGENATFSPHGFVMSVENAVALIYKMRERMIDNGHPDPFPPQPGIYTQHQGSGGGGAGPQGNAGGGPGRGPDGEV